MLQPASPPAGNPALLRPLVPAPHFDPDPGNAGTGTKSPEQAVRRWRIDGWAMVRQGSSVRGLSAVGGPSAYGASQAGALLRYRLGDARADSPFLFARASQALVDGGQTELSLGMGWLPLASLPIAAYGDLRVTDGQGQRLVRPAAYLVTEFAPWRIDQRIEAEAYLQAGYVAGEFATPFVDGQARIERRMARVGDAEVRFGAAGWGGAQEGAARLDLGPSASLRFDIGDVPVRLTADYRFRLAGDAEPGSGAAVTIVSGF